MSWRNGQRHTICSSWSSWSPVTEEAEGDGRLGDADLADGLKIARCCWPPQLSRAWERSWLTSNIADNSSGCRLYRDRLRQGRAEMLSFGIKERSLKTSAAAFVLGIGK